MKRLRWEPPEAERRLPKHPYRDSALLYGALAIIVVVVAFIAASIYSCWYWRDRLRERDEEERG